jgi:excisionase family DNA binding protein
MFDKRNTGAEPAPSPVRAGMNAPSDKFLTIQEVGERLNVCRTTIWRLMNQHGLRFVRIGGTRRIREQDLETWLERHSVSRNGGKNGDTED